MRGLNNSSSVLQAQAVSFRYPQDSRGLQPFTLEIPAGDGVLVSGPSGCGKSTLARCLTGLIPHLYHGEMRGAVWLAGQRTDQTPLWKLAEHAGIVFQNPASQMIAPSVEDEMMNHPQCWIPVPILILSLKSSATSARVKLRLFLSIARSIYVASPT